MEYLDHPALNYGIVLVLLILGYVFGQIAEKRHYRSILRREAMLSGLIVITTKTLDMTETIRLTVCFS